MLNSTHGITKSTMTLGHGWLIRSFWRYAFLCIPKARRRFIPYLPFFLCQLNMIHRQIYTFAPLNAWITAIWYMPPLLMLICRDVWRWLSHIRRQMDLMFRTYKCWVVSSEQKGCICVSYYSYKMVWLWDFCVEGNNLTFRDCLCHTRWLSNDINILHQIETMLEKYTSCS